MKFFVFCAWLSVVLVFFQSCSKKHGTQGEVWYWKSEQPDSIWKDSVYFKSKQKGISKVSRIKMFLDSFISNEKPQIPDQAISLDTPKLKLLNKKSLNHQGDSLTFKKYLIDEKLPTYFIFSSKHGIVYYRSYHNSSIELNKIVLYKNGGKQEIILSDLLNSLKSDTTFFPSPPSPPEPDIK